MELTTNSLRPFIGAKDYAISRDFYTRIGFTERIISPDMSLFIMGTVSFYLQDAYVKDWVDNSMLFLEIAELDAYLDHLKSIDITSIKGVRLSKIQDNDWGREFFMHDPSGILWHIGNFKSH